MYRKQAYERSSGAKKSELVLKPIGHQPTRDLRSESLSSGDSRSSSKVSSGRSFADAIKDDVSTGSSIGHRPNPVPRAVKQPKAESRKQPVTTDKQPTEPVNQPTEPVKQPTESVKQPLTDKSVSDKFCFFPLALHCSQREAALLPN